MKTCTECSNPLEVLLACKCCGGMPMEEPVAWGEDRSGCQVHRAKSNANQGFEVSIVPFGRGRWVTVLTVMSDWTSHEVSKQFKTEAEAVAAGECLVRTLQVVFEK